MHRSRRIVRDRVIYRKTQCDEGAPKPCVLAGIPVGSAKDASEVEGRLHGAVFAHEGAVVVDEARPKGVEIGKRCQRDEQRRYRAQRPCAFARGIRGVERSRVARSLGHAARLLATPSPYKRRSCYHESSPLPPLCCREEGM